jgi:dipeptidyl aminopeptidase/acylaminoacyl peptidase
LFLQSYLPLNGTNLVERGAREKTIFPVEIYIPSREFRKVVRSEFLRENNGDSLRVLEHENVNTPPKIYVSSPKIKREVLLLDLNPQFNQLNFGKVLIVRWVTHGTVMVGGLYLPPDYVPGRRYPLVIQTHGFDADEFSMDGRSEWSSGYAARALAAKQVLVLQTHAFQDSTAENRLEADSSLGVTPEQRLKNFMMLVYEGAIDALDQRGLIDRNRVGIMGFSRTVCFVGNTLTHSNYPFTAALLVDGIDCGYFGYIAFGGNPDADDLNGGGPPFGKNLAEWLKEAPGFNLDKVHTPVRLEAHGASSGLLEQWEWFSGLSALGKPVDDIYLPDAPHLLVKPWERMTSQQGAVDWFRFWLQGYEDPDPAKAAQYRRWEGLRKLQQANEAKTAAATNQ